MIAKPRALVLHFGSIFDPLDVLGHVWGVLGWLWAHFGSLSLPWQLHLAAFGSLGDSIWLH